MESATIGLQDRIDALLLRRVNESAGIDKDDISLICLGREFVAVEFGISKQDFGIDEVLGTAKADQTDFAGFRNLGSAHRLEIIC
jgi:hypothetical protein